MQTLRCLQARGEWPGRSPRCCVRGIGCILHFALCISLTSCARQPLSRAQPAAAIAPDLVIITWNLHAGAGDLPQLLEDLAKGRLIGPAPVASFILLLQEAGPDIVDFARERGLSAYFEPVHPARGNAIVSTHPLINARTIELPRERQRRVAVAANVMLGDTLLQVASAHFENRVSWWRGGLFSEGARRRQAEALIAALPPGAPVVVGGDFNAWLGRNEPAWRALAERFPDGPPPLPQPTFRQRLFLDEVFFDLPDGWQVTRSILENTYDSDHHAVVAALRLPR
jgi:endonuclease/exonuclease/phosphatase family metal-dependent hydrolase